MVARTAQVDNMHQIPAHHEPRVPTSQLHLEKRLRETTTIIQPVEPHYYGTRLDRVAVRVINFLCRCQNPNGHCDAWACISEETYALDPQRQEMNWKQLCNRVLDHCNKTNISRQEEIEALRYVTHPQDYEYLLDHHRYLDWACGIGRPIDLTHDGEGVQDFTGDGHVRNNVTEG